MKFLLYKRFLSFFINLSFYGVIVFIIFKDRNINDMKFFVGFLFLIFLFQFLSNIYLKGKNLGSLIFKLSILDISGNKMNWKQSLLRNFLNLFDFLTLYSLHLLNFKRDFNKQSFLEVYTDTVIVEDKFKDFKIFNKVSLKKKILNFSIFFIFNFFFLYSISTLVLSDFKTTTVSIHNEFNSMINKNLKKLNFEDKGKYKYVRDCIWYDDEQILEMPVFVLKLYFSPIQYRKSELMKMNLKFKKCIEDIYTFDEIKATQS